MEAISFAYFSPSCTPLTEIQNSRKAEYTFLQNVNSGQIIWKAETRRHRVFVLGTDDTDDTVVSLRFKFTTRIAFLLMEECILPC